MQYKYIIRNTNILYTIQTYYTQYIYIVLMTNDLPNKAPAMMNDRVSKN